MLIETFERRGRVFSCGNGGSMCDAMHFAEELTGRYRSDRAALGATAISDPGHLTCVGNDLGYEQVFSRYLEAHGRAGDCLVALSTSGSSRNILRAAEAARSLDVVAADSTDPDALWVTEVWDSPANHRASLSLPAVQQAIKKGRPLIAGFGERFETRPIGGFGLAKNAAPS